MVALRRHRLVRLTPAGWQCVQARAWPDAVRQCLAHWASADLPLVVARQPAVPDVADGVHLGLPAPARWGRQRIALRAAACELVAFDAGFPAAHAVAPLVPPAARRAWCALCDALAAHGVDARVHGSFGWQVLSGLDAVHAGSDLDLLLPVADAAHADAVAACVGGAAIDAPRLDGELVFADGSAVAWREWPGWRAGRSARILVKRLDGVALAADAGWLDGVPSAAAAAAAGTPAAAAEAVR